MHGGRPPGHLLAYGGPQEGRECAGLGGQGWPAGLRARLSGASRRVSGFSSLAEHGGLADLESGFIITSLIR